MAPRPFGPSLPRGSVLAQTERPYCRAIRLSLAQRATQSSSGPKLWPQGKERAGPDVLTLSERPSLLYLAKALRLRDAKARLARRR